MYKNYLLMKWDYEYNKESTWYDEDSGEEQYELVEGAKYLLPHLREKYIEIRSISLSDSHLKVEIYVDYKTYILYNDGNSVMAYANYDYSVAGDSVSQTLSMNLKIK